MKPTTRTPLSRRGFVGVAAAAALAAPALGRPRQPAQPALPSPPPKGPPQDLALVKEFVGVAHAKFERVKEMLAEHPSLVNASWDWGGGDWETALGAAAHVGQPEIARHLLEHGARLDLFASAMLGHVELVATALAQYPGAHRTLGPHGIPLYHHALAGGEDAAGVLALLEPLYTRADGVRDLPLSPAEMRRYAGRYEGRGGVQEVGSEGWHLTISDGGRLMSQGDHEFRRADAPGERIVFIMVENRAARVEVGGSVSERVA